MTKAEKMKTLYHSRKDQGLCVKCGKKLDRDGVYCEGCNQKKNRENRENRKAWKKLNICPQCGKNILYGDEKSCLECKNRRYNYYWNVEKKLPEGERKRKSEQSQEAEKKRIAKRIQEGLCIKCGKRKAENGIQMCGICREKNREYYASKRREKGIRTAEEYNEERKMRADQGFCYLCGKPSFGRHRVCEEHYAVLWEVTHLPQVKEARERLKISLKK